MHLAANPYLLWMFLQIYLEAGTIPSNRGALFDEFVFQLLKREGLAVDDKLSAEGAGIERSAGRVGLGHAASGGGVRETWSWCGAYHFPARGDPILGGEERLYRAASANLLEDAEPVRFTHQLIAGILHRSAHGRRDQRRTTQRAGSLA